MSKESHRVVVILDDKLHEKLLKYAEKKHIGKSTAIRMILSEYLNGRDAQ